jgi:hypothetical protein
LGLLAVDGANGALHVATYGKTMSELAAHQLSTLIGAAALGVAIWFIVRTWPPHRIVKRWQLGWSRRGVK